LDRADVDDRAPAGSRQRLQEILRAEKGAVEVRRDGVAPALERRLGHRFELRDPGVVDEDVDAPVLGDDGVRKVPHGLLVPHVEDEPRRAGTDPDRPQFWKRSWRRFATDLSPSPGDCQETPRTAECTLPFMADHRWTVESLRPWVLECIDAWGTERAFFGTNWPVDRLSSSYGDVLDAYVELIADFTADEQAALFSGNANRIFRL
jgi:hypothetical protein